MRPPDMVGSYGWNVHYGWWGIQLRGSGGRGIWLIAELVLEAPSFALALSDAGSDLLELGYVDLDELQSIGCTKNVFFAPKPSWSVHDDARKATKMNRIVT